MYDKHSLKEKAIKGIQRLWSACIKEVIAFDDGRYSNCKSSNLCLLVNEKCKWVIIICDMKRRRYIQMLLDDSEYENVDGDMLALA